jgi:Flp pilus assembly protein TadD
MIRLDALRSLATLVVAGSASVFCSAVPVGRAQTPAQLPVQPPSPAASDSPAPKLPPAELGDAMMYHKRYQAAIAAYASEPQKTATVWNQMGIAYQMMLNLNDATRCYRESLKLDPRNPNVLNNLGTALQSLGDFREAEHNYRKAIQIDPNFALGYKNLATSLMAHRKYKQGREADARALALDPTIFAPGNSLTVDNPTSVRDRGAMNYYMAIDCARAGQTTCALEHLRMAINQGYTSAIKVATDSNFAALSNDPKFQQLLAELSGT